MKKLFLLLLNFSVLLTVTSCEYILKPRETKDQDQEEIKNIVLGADKDKHGCVTSAGYRWSETKQNCIRVFEQGMRLVPISESDIELEDETDQAKLNAYLIVDSNKKRAEVFIIADTTKTIVLEEKNENLYENKNWKLHLEKQYKLEQNGVLKYISPTAYERKTIGTDTEEN